jgi:hypothetical protein
VCSGSLPEQLADGCSQSVQYFYEPRTDALEGDILGAVIQNSEGNAFSFF